VQGTLRYRVLAKDDTTDVCHKQEFERPWWAVEESTEFYPDVQFHGRPVLYLTKTYEKLLRAYLAIDPRLQGEALSEAIDVACDKAEFLSPEMAIFRLYWGDWNFVTLPEVWTIDFNSDITKARVYIRDSWSTGGELCLEKSEGRWVVISNIRWFE
jgi:hypothetical protein